MCVCVCGWVGGWGGVAGFLHSQGTGFSVTLKSMTYVRYAYLGRSAYSGAMLLPAATLPAALGSGTCRTLAAPQWSYCTARVTLIYDWRKAGCVAAKPRCLSRLRAQRRHSCRHFNVAHVILVTRPGQPDTGRTALRNKCTVLRERCVRARPIDV